VMEITLFHLGIHLINYVVLRLIFWFSDNFVSGPVIRQV